MNYRLIEESYRELRVPKGHPLILSVDYFFPERTASFESTGGTDMIFTIIPPPEVSSNYMIIDQSLPSQKSQKRKSNKYKPTPLDRLSQSKLAKQRDR